MKVIVSTEVQDIFNNFVVVDTLDKVLKLKGVSTVILHKIGDDSFNAGVSISELHKQGVTRFIYISAEPLAVIRMAIKGVDGHYFEDEFYLEDEEELLSLLEDIDGDSSGCTELATTSAQIVSNFIQSFARGDERIKAPMYLEQVSQAVNELCTITHQQELQISAMGNSAIELFQKASSIIKSMDDQRKLIERQLEDLETKQISAPQPMGLGNSVQFFSPYKYNGSSKVLLVREISSCRYLTSMLLGYVQYVRYTLNKRVKLIFVVQKGAGVLSKYDNFAKITEAQTAYEDSLYSADIVVTNNPKRDVMKKLLSNGMDLYVVVDRLYGSSDIVTGRCSKINAVSGKSDLSRFNLKADKCIFPITSIKGEFCCIPTIKGFPSDTDARYVAYAQACKDIYLKLDTLSGISK